MELKKLAAAPLALLLAGCSASGSGASSSQSPGPPSASSSVRATAAGNGAAFTAAEVASFDEPWAMTFLPDGRALVTEKGGRLQLVDVTTGQKVLIQGTPDVADAGQGGLGDIIAAPSYGSDGKVYLSWVESVAAGQSRAVVATAVLRTQATATLSAVTPIWRQDPTSGTGHFSHRLAVSPDGRYLFVSSGERQKMDPAQDARTNLGKVLRLNLDGTPAAGNPFADRGGAAAQVWSLGHRNPLGLAFDESGNLWSSEMGPQGGDELNLITKGANYGWPRASNGSHYDGRDIPDHASGDGFSAPKAWWNPSISPSSLVMYSGTAFPQWRGDAFVGALSGRALIRLDVAGTSAAKADQWDMGARIREVEQGPDGALWVLQDGASGKLVKLSPPT